MLNQHELSISEHLARFNRLGSNQDEIVLVYEEDGISYGVVNFRRIDETDCARWGFYVALCSPKGKGSRLGKTALNYSFHEMGLQEIHCRVIAENSASQGYHRKLSFAQIEGLALKTPSGFSEMVDFSLRYSDWPNACSTLQ